MKIYELIKELKNNIPADLEDVIESYADLIVDESSKSFTDVAYETTECCDLDIIYYSDAIDFIRDHWDEVDEVIGSHEADSLFGAVQFAAEKVKTEGCFTYWSDAVKIAVANYLFDKGVKDIDPLQFKEYEAYIDDEVRDCDCFDDVVAWLENVENKEG